MLCLCLSAADLSPCLAEGLKANLGSQVHCGACEITPEMFTLLPRHTGLSWLLPTHSSLTVPESDPALEQKK